MTRSAIRQESAAPSRIQAALWFAVLTAPAAVAAYYRIFSGFSEWDDEGTLMMMVRQYLDGSKLYEGIFSGYGPVYFFYSWLLRAVTGVPLDHNSVRITSAVLSVICPLICAWMVLRLTRSLAAASVAHILVFRGMLFFTNEPGHPQELCILLLLGVAATGLLAANPRYAGLAMALAGAAAAALTLVKINVGIFAILAIAVAFLFQMPSSWFWRLAKFGAAGASLALPLILMRVHLNDPAAQAYCVVVTAAMAGVLCGAQAFARPGDVSVREALVAAAGFAATFAVCLLALAWQGVSMQATYNALITNQVRMNVSPGFWYGPVELPRAWIAWALTGLAGALYTVRAERSMDGRLDRPLPIVQVAFGFAGIGIALVAPGLLLGFVTPFCWLLLFPLAEDRRPRQVHARLLLCTATVLQTLNAYPMAGSQTYFLRVLLMVVPAVSLMDGLRALSVQTRYSGLILRFARPAAIATMAVVALAYPALAYRAERLYASLTPLDLPGAERIHADPAFVEDYRWLVPLLRRNCDTFVSLPGLPSLYFWTGKPLPGPVDKLPGPLNMDQWMDLFTPAQQDAIVEDFSRHPNACAVYHPSGVDFWNTGHHDVHSWPVAHYVLTNFKTIGQSGDYQFMIRKDRQLEVPAGVRREPPPPRSR